jgi:hypothetical protein
MSHCFCPFEERQVLEYQRLYGDVDMVVRIHVLDLDCSRLQLWLQLKVEITTLRFWNLESSTER